MLAALLLLGATELPLVVIDPGHGGAADGAIGVCGAKEKDVTLAISRETAEVLRASGRAQVLLTRETDADISLEARSAIANVAGAALFISIHANSSTRVEARGVETYFLTLRTADRRAAQVAARENEGGVATAHEHEDALGQIIGGLVLSAAHAESQRLALRLQESLHQRLDERGRGVLQAPFIVLANTKMAASLVEVGFLSNEVECALLAAEEHQRRTAEALAAGILAHLLHETEAYAKR
jgi:N-acetylmuramoyl-L-alanine amidase